MCLLKQWWPLHFETIFHIPVGLISSLTSSPSSAPSSSKMGHASDVVLAAASAMKEQSHCSRGSSRNQATLEVAAEAWKQAGSQDSLLSSLTCFLKMAWLTQTSFSCFLLLKSWCDPLVWSAWRSRCNQEVRGMRCIAKSFIPWPDVCMCGCHYRRRAIRLINHRGGFVDSLGLASLSVMPSTEGWPHLDPKDCELLAEHWWGKDLPTAQHSKGCDNSSEGQKEEIPLPRKHKGALFFPPGVAAT